MIREHSFVYLITMDGLLQLLL